MLSVLLLDSVDWSRQIHMYGKATDTPTHLRALLGNDTEAIHKALQHLDSAPLHQGTVAPAAVTCAQFIVTALNEKAISQQCAINGVLEWLGELGSSIDYDVPEEKPRVDNTLLEELFQMNDDEMEEFFDFLDDNGMELMDSLYIQSLQELHAYAPNVVDTLTRFGATQEARAGWEKYAH
ncbi:hypothetical protein [Corynebacterium durum]|uniref:Uncharacterized protein n=1 Tax=Corynebacterium durum F0235 TaxID=1035195 RepID=L1MMD9_9CORY|nr:hypothetical protein [Corynebacterium durum]EKX92220.1 hypothetical protein HMPREF9997_00265 [Corynebacterium durum F0235]